MSDKKLYNPELKEKFLSTYPNEQTRTTIKYILFKAEPIENKLKKDLSNFSISDIKEVLQNTDPLNINVSIGNARFISQYINWSIDNGYRGNRDNPLDGIEEKWYEDTISKKKLYISENELLELELKLVNYQDKCALWLMFEGVLGHNMSEIINLKVQDINFNTRELKLTDPKYAGEVRNTIIVSKHCMDLIKGALTEREYKNKNGLATRNPETPLVDNDYVIRPVDRKVSDPSAPADMHVVFRRIKVISQLFSIPHLTPKSVHKSGMIKMGKDLYLRDGKLDKDQIYEIGDKFGLRRIQQGEHSFHNRTSIERDVNRENILVLYGIDIAK